MKHSNATITESARSSGQPARTSAAATASYMSEVAESAVRGCTASSAIVGGCEANARRYPRAHSSSASSQGRSANGAVGMRSLTRSRTPAMSSCWPATWL